MSTSNEHLDFSHLDEETETDDRLEAAAATPQGQSVDLGSIQPHLPAPPSAARRRNPRERGVVIVDEESRERAQEKQPSFDDEAGQDATDSGLGEAHPTFDHNSNHVNSQNNRVDSENVAETPPTSTSTVSGVDSRPNETNNNTSSVQICYSKNAGNVGVREVPVGTSENGAPYVATRQIAQDWEESERRPLKKKRITRIKILSVVAAILFFPTGLFAAYFGFRIQKEFEEGILRGNIDRAHKFATRSERLSILSIILSILVAALVVTLIERPQFQSQHYQGTVTG